MKNPIRHTLLKTFLFFTAALLFQNTFGQFEKHLFWTSEVEQVSGNIYNVKIICTLDEGWHVYSQFTEEGGPNATVFNFENNKDIERIGKVQEIGKLEKKFDDLFGVTVSSFADKVTFVQKVKVLKPGAILKGSFDGQVCKDMCILFGPENFSITFDGKNTAPVITDSVPVKTNAAIIDTAQIPKGNFAVSKFDTSFVNSACSVKAAPVDRTIWLVFLLGFLGGLVALLTPCVFPMVPLTVSFFTKGGKNRKEGLRKALTYGASIIVIYVALGLLVTKIFGSDALNVLSTNMWFNLLFFFVFVIFALSFFGFFEITLPASWANKADSLASKGGNIGIFFMAFTLALVSFSCTGPIIGTLLVETATRGQLYPAVGMFGFALALALPFTLFALFPQWLHSLPKSGGWLNTVKDILGFLELALAFKFLSIVDMTQNWGILRWEPFLAIWILIFLGLALYSFGIIRFPHDDKREKPGVVRLAIGLFSVLFVAYLGYGLFSYQPLKLLSGIVPPPSYNFRSHNKEPFIHFKDYDEGLAYAREHNMPVLIDFTGFGCTNCRRIEANVWTDKRVLDLMQKYVVISLYVDDRKLLPQNKWYMSDANGQQRQIQSVGQKWSDFQARYFQTNSQPYYVLINTREQLLNYPVAYNFASDVNNYRAFLECGLTMKKQLK